MIMKNEYFKELINFNIETTLIDDYLIYFIIKYIEKKRTNWETNEKLLKFFKLIIKTLLITYQNENNEYDFKEHIDEFITIFLFTQGYQEDIQELFDRYLDISKFVNNFEITMENIVEENKIRYEVSLRNQKYTKTVNIYIFNIVESFIRSILSYSIDLIKIDRVKFKEYFIIFKSIENSVEKINMKYYLFSKEIFNLRNIIKIEEANKDNYEQFENNYIKIINNLLLQSYLFYEEDYNKLFNTILDLIDIIEQAFKLANDVYSNLIFFIYTQAYKNIIIEDIRFKLLEKIINNKLLLLKYPKIILVETLKDLKPEPIRGKNRKESLVNNFMNLDNNKLKKFRKIIDIYNSINSREFDEILLYFFEGLCQSYFLSILNKNNSEYNVQCCFEMLLGLSLDYLKKAILYLCEYNNNTKITFLKYIQLLLLKVIFIIMYK